MIALDRGAEPAELARLRRRWLARAVLAQGAGRAPDFKAYDAGKETLYDRVQHGKCAWCESSIGRYASVEHVRPKAGAATGDPRGTRPHRPDDLTRYWWLAWTWGNQLVSCDDCNGAKWSWFACEPGTAPLPLPAPGAALDAAMPCFNLAAERPMLVDPTRDDPRAHIVWRPSAPRASSEDLDWHPFGMTRRGRYTIAALKLDGVLKDRVNDHLRRRVWSSLLRPLQRAITAGPYAEARRYWREQTAVLFAQREPYHAATADALCWWRSHLGLAPQDFTVPAVGAPLNPIRDLDPPEPALLAAQPDTVRLAVRAAENAGEAVGALCAARAWTATDLAAATGYALTTVEAALRAAVMAGALRYDPTTDTWVAA